MLINNTHKLLAFVIVILLMMSPLSTNAQVHSDTVVTSTAPSRYDVHSRFEPDNSLIIGVHGGLASSKDDTSHRRSVLEIGIGWNSEGHEGFHQTCTSIELNKIDGRIISGFILGFDAKWLIDFGLSLNCMTDFSSRRAVFFRLRAGIYIMYGLWVTYENDMPILSPNFDILDREMFSVRLDLGILKKIIKMGVRN